jgi:hypothetical protein
MFAIQIARSKSGALAYLREHMSNADYLTEQGEQMLVWQGAGANRLGLSGQVTEKVYANLLSGLTPDSTPGNHRPAKKGQALCLPSRPVRSKIG